MQQAIRDYFAMADAARSSVDAHPVAVATPDAKREWWVQRDKNGNPIPPVVDTAACVESIDKAVAAKLVRADEMRKALYGGAVPVAQDSRPMCARCNEHVAMFSATYCNEAVRVCSACALLVNAPLAPTADFVSVENVHQTFAALPVAAQVEAWNIMTKDCENAEPSFSAVCATTDAECSIIEAKLSNATHIVMSNGEEVLSYYTREHATATDALIAEVKRLRCLLAQRPEPDTRAQVVCDHGYDD